MVAITAAVTRSQDDPHSFEELVLDEPRHDELLVRIIATGICHTDLTVMQGKLPTPRPMVLGHEGAGIVEQVGSAVTGFQPGDRVVLSYACCGQCATCLTGHQPYCEELFSLTFGGKRADGSTTMVDSDGGVVHGSFFGQSSFATHALVPALNAVKVPEAVDLELVGPLACGIQTGAGSILNSLDVGVGAKVVISGTGAVGLAAVLAARAAGATTIIAVDVLAARLDLARELGATHVIDGNDVDAVSAHVQAIAGGNVDYALDTTGVPSVIAADLASVKLGGTVGLVASSPPQSSLPLASVARKNLRGILQGDAVPRDFIPRLLALHQRGDFPFDRLITKYRFDELGSAIADTQSGAAVKAVLLMP